MNAVTAPLVKLGQSLLGRRYRFVTVTPETHRRVIEREAALGRSVARSLRDIFGWNKPFERDLLPPDLMRLLMEAGACDEQEGLLRSKVRFSSLNQRLFVHSAFPTTDANAVFFGPDTYRFCALLARTMAPPRRVVDVGCGSGAGGLCLSDAAENIVLSDINEGALALARVNAELAGVHAEITASDVLQGIDGEVDLVVANPPYLRDDGERMYREGGGLFGEGLAVRIVQEALDRLPRNGRLIIYTGTAIVDGQDQFLRAIEPLLAGKAEYKYEELDPDVFGEELSRPAYQDVDRLAAVALSARRL